MRKQVADGFTIVELLIVIVVIAILASISTTTFAGVQQRAINTAQISEARKMKGLIEQYLVINGAAALQVAVPSYAYYCLGSGYTDLDPGTGTACDVYQDTEENTPYYISKNSALDNALKSQGNYSVGAFVPVEEKDEWTSAGTTYTYFEKTSAPYMAPYYLLTNFRVDGQPAFLRLTYVLKGDDADCKLGNVMVFTSFVNPISNFSTQTGAKNSGYGGGVTYCNIHIPKP